MKILGKILIVVVIFLVVLFILAYGVFKLKGKDIVAAKLEQALDREVSIKDVSLSFPLIIKIKGLDIQQIAKVDYLSASTSVFGILGGKVILNNITLKNPYFMIERFEDESLNLKPKKTQKATKDPTSEDSLKDSSAKKPPFVLLSFDITGGKILFRDRKADIKDFVINVEDIDVHMSKANFSLNDLTAKFRISGIIYGLDPEKKATLNTVGQIDVIKKNMDGNLNLEGLDASLLAPYLGGFLPLDAVSKGMVSIESDLKAENNNLVIDSHLEIENLAKEILLEEEIAEGSQGIDDIVLNSIFLLQGETDKVALDFIIKTKLDNPRFDNITLKTSTFKDMILKNITDPLFGQGDGIEGIEDNFKKFKDVFKK